MDLGADPETGELITVRSGRFGRFVQRGEGDKPPRASIPKDVSISGPEDLDWAVKLLSLPRTIGTHPETGEPITASIGKAALGPIIGKALTDAVAGGAIGKGVGALGGLKTQTLAAAGITILATAAYLSVKEFNQEKGAAAGAESDKLKSAGKMLEEAQAEFGAKGTLGKDKLNDLARVRAELEGASGRAGRYNEGEDVSWFEKFGAKVYGSTFGDEADAKNLAEYEGSGNVDASQKATIDSLNAKLDGLIKAVVDSKQKGPIDVNVVGGMASPAGGGRTGVPDQGS
jgi:hypothetical protein